MAWKCLKMGAETAREPAGELDCAVAGTAAACRGQNGLECHSALLPEGICVYNVTTAIKVTPPAAGGDEGEMSVIHKLIMAMVLCVFAALPAQAATKINFMYTAVASWVGLYVAKDQGILAKHGLDIDMTLTTNGSLISAALVADTAQLGGPTPTILLQANEQGLDLVVVAGTNVYPLASPSGVVAAADSNLHGPKDLEGKRVGVPGLGGIIDVLIAEMGAVEWARLSQSQLGRDRLSADGRRAEEPSRRRGRLRSTHSIRVWCRTRPVTISAAIRP